MKTEETKERELLVLCEKPRSAHNRKRKSRRGERKGKRRRLGGEIRRERRRDEGRCMEKGKEEEI